MEHLLETCILKGEIHSLDVHKTSGHLQRGQRNTAQVLPGGSRTVAANMALHGNVSIFSLVTMEKAGTMSNSRICAALQSGWDQ